MGIGVSEIEVADVTLQGLDRNRKTPVRRMCKPMKQNGNAIVRKG